jgi:hypothetical protein
MTSEDRKPTRTADGAPRKRRPYHKPAFKHERVFETMALSCGKVGATGGPCTATPKSS